MNTRETELKPVAWRVSNGGKTWQFRATPVEGWNYCEPLYLGASELYDALQKAIDCGIIPKSSARDGGANRHSEHVRVADQCRAAIAKARGES